MGFVATTYAPEQTTALLTDRYHLTTAYPYWREGRADNPAVFYMFGRKEGLQGGYTVAGGLEGVIDIVKRWHEHGITADDIAYLRTQTSAEGRRIFPEEFLGYLKNMEFKLKIDAAPEGSVFFPQEPVLRVEGPLAQAKMLESIALGIINGHSGYITQAARQTDVLVEELENGSPTGSASVQGLRRGPSLGAAIEASRSLGAGGYTSSSTGTAAKQFGQVFAGTMDHAWVMTHEKELNDIPLAELCKMEEEGRWRELQEALARDAFRSYAMAFPDGGIFLVDTYDPLQGLENAITVMKEMRALGVGQNYGVRFDSGDIVGYSKVALRRFAEEGFVEGLDPAKAKDMSDAALLKMSDRCTAFCAAADGIDEYEAAEMRAAGGFFRAWGVGTAGSHVDPIGLVYKASEVLLEVVDDPAAAKGKPRTGVMKIASNAPVKSSNPGKINSRRYYDADGKITGVVIYDETLGLDPARGMVNLRDFDDKRTREITGNYEDLLVPVFDENGSCVFKGPPRKESYPGSREFVTDLSAIAKKVRSGLASLPDAARRVVRPRREVLQQTLAEAFNAAKEAGQTRVTLDIADIEATLPPEVGHVPVFLDSKLFAQRRACETRHLGHVSAGQVGEYRERFEGQQITPKGPRP